MTALQEIIFGVVLLTVGLVLECFLDEWRYRRKKAKRQTEAEYYRPVRLVIKRSKPKAPKS